MDYIDIDKFLNQSEEVQKAFKDWWKPKRGDLFFIDNYKEYNPNHSIIETNSDNTVGYCDYVDGSLEISYVKIKDIEPLLTEGQLRKFIESKINSPVIPYYYLDEGYIINNIKAGKVDLLEAYWEMACKIAANK
jgi:hypothetical protein